VEALTHWFIGVSILFGYFESFYVTPSTATRSSSQLSLAPMVKAFLTQYYSTQIVHEHYKAIENYKKRGFSHLSLEKRCLLDKYS